MISRKMILLLTVILLITNGNAKGCDEICDRVSNFGIDQTSCLTTCSTCESALDQSASEKKQWKALKVCVFEGLELPKKSKKGRFCKEICNGDKACKKTCKNCVKDLKQSGLDKDELTQAVMSCVGEQRRALWFQPDNSWMKHFNSWWANIMTKRGFSGKNENKRDDEKSEEESDEEKTDRKRDEKEEGSEEKTDRKRDDESEDEDLVDSLEKDLESFEEDFDQEGSEDEEKENKRWWWGGRGRLLKRGGKRGRKFWGRKSGEKAEEKTVEKAEEKTEEKDGKHKRKDWKLEDVCKKCEKSDDVEACTAECDKCLESVDKEAELKTQFQEMFKCMEPQFKKELAEICDRCEKSDDVEACKAQCETCLKEIDVEAELRVQFKEMKKCMKGKKGEEEKDEESENKRDEDKSEKTFDFSKMCSKVCKYASKFGVEDCDNKCNECATLEDKEEVFTCVRAIFNKE